MKSILFILFLILCTPLLAADWSFSGNLEGQFRRSWNNPEAQKLPFPLTQDWDQDWFSIFYGNLNPKVEFENSQLEANLFVRHGVSELYRNEYLATRLYTFPNKLVARNMFRMTFTDEQDRSLTEGVINKLYYEHSFERVRIMFGRMFINYGLGEIFNPINPFNQPTGLTSLQSVAQGNDGAQFKYFLNDHHAIDLILLGDKTIENDKDIDHTVWIHGEIEASDKLTLNYLGGQDQKRNKIGGQLAYKFSDAMAFGQILYQSALIESGWGKSHSLLDLLLGYDEQLSARWHLRLEGGYQQKNRNFAPAATGERFLPVEYFVAIANQFEVHPLLRLTGTVVNDFTTGFTYLLGKSTLSLGNNVEGELFFFSPVAKGRLSDSRGNQANSFAQRLVSQDLGLALRAFF